MNALESYDPDYRLTEQEQLQQQLEDRWTFDWTCERALRVDAFGDEEFESELEVLNIPGVFTPPATVLYGRVFYRVPFSSS